MRRLSLALLFLSLLAACAPPTALPPSPPVPADAALKARLLEELTRLGRAFHSAEGFARVKLHLRERDISARQVLLLEKPDRLRAETLSPFGQPMLVSATDGENLDVYLPGEGAFYSGEASLENFQRFVPIPLQVADLVHILLYQVPVISYEEGRVDAIERGYLLTLSGGQGLRQLLLFDHDLRLTGADYMRDEVLQLRVRYGRFREGVHPFPLLVELEMPTVEASASLEFSDVLTNTAIPEQRFQLAPPSGTEIRSLP